MARMKFNAFEFEVEGDGDFPVDMLRYDNCVPHSQQDVVNIFSRFEKGKRRVRLRAYTPPGHTMFPTYDRWASFTGNWQFVPGSHRVVSR